MTILAPNNKQKDIIQKLRHEAEEKRAEEKAKKLGLHYINLFYTPINVEELVTLPEKDSRKSGLAVIRKTGKILHIGITNPNNSETQKTIESLKEKGYTLRLFLISERSLKKAWKRYETYVPPAPTLKETLTIQKESLDKFKEEIKDIEKLKEQITVVSTTELLTTIIAGAIKVKASDIHLEPIKNAIRLRYRIDGFLQDIVEFKKENYKFLLSRIKLLSGLKINVHDISQDGRFSVNINDDKEIIKELDMRVSIVPTGFGETIVMRLLGLSIKKLNLQDLGIDQHIYKALEQELSKPHGLILNTGPTGSGKTTTLYAALNLLNKPGVKIITIENPIEYKLEGITQTQVNAKKGYTFTEGLKSALRQDPDIIMVGEIRDEVTAGTAIHAALTGHLVFSTLHTNSASDTIVRLVDMGTDKKILPTAINAVIAQRLVRRLCEKCKTPYKPNKETIKTIKKTLSLISPKTSVPLPKEISTLYKAKGCPDCFGLGYDGQVGIFEIFTINNKIEKLILKGTTSYELLATAIEEGMVTLLQDGILKSIQGITSLEEIKRVAGDAKYIESLYGEAVSSLLTNNLEIEATTTNQIKDLKNNVEEFSEILNSKPIEDLLEWIVSGAIIERATDIHLEPSENSFLIRYRVDGILKTSAKLPKELFLSLIAELKILSGLKTEIHKKIQEGRFNIQLANETETQDTRVSIIPGGYGEAAVIRILRRGVEKTTLKDLGFQKNYLKIINKELANPNGIILVTGPTSAGKTTTLYALLNKVNTPDTKILTVEDPIEYRLPGILQTQVNTEEDYTFASALRSFLRQNPNIMMVGEIRDKETADIAIRASLTGHLVFSTLHTNTAIESIQRLGNIGIDAKDIASSINMVIAQRLVRRLCLKCRSEYKPSEEELEFIKNNLPSKLSEPTESLKLYKSNGCEDCSNGYRGQVGIFEIFINTHEIQDLISKKASIHEIEAKAKESGMITMKQDGVTRAIEGVTTLEEIRRVTE